MFRWAAEEELLPGSVYADLRAVASLRKGKTDARETQKFKPVPQEHIDAALPFMPAVVQAMVRFELLTGCRPSEVCRLRPIDIDRSEPTCWVYRPGSDEVEHGEHKTAHHGHDRLILIGPKGQEVLTPYLSREPTSYCFQPGDAVAARNAKRRQERQTPLYASHLKHMASKRKAKPKRVPGECYDTKSYNHAIARACRKASVPAWSPNRLRHNRATELRRHGLDVTKTVLGHSRVETSLIYAEKDLEKAKKLMAEIG